MLAWLVHSRGQCMRRIAQPRTQISIPSVPERRANTTATAFQDLRRKFVQIHSPLVESWPLLKSHCMTAAAGGMATPHPFECLAAGVSDVSVTIQWHGTIIASRSSLEKTRRGSLPFQL